MFWRVSCGFFDAKWELFLVQEWEPVFLAEETRAYILVFKWKRGEFCIRVVEELDQLQALWGDDLATGCSAISVLHGYANAVCNAAKM
ncbi:ubiquitin-like-specific protease ESD4-like protein [Corchorus olitorius]|uniref:Ubiquitin-like-specific protease ESD4-like protein n=1 Tax=Corchorus olitorius TaxID=93759 RepID=A0A1R3KLB5_9ROSI|nr:ubiquitin-like-specific protease ESD4-like protein [Corchorus olitorius]